MTDQEIAQQVYSRLSQWEPVVGMQVKVIGPYHANQILKIIEYNQRLADGKIHPYEYPIILMAVGHDGIGRLTAFPKKDLIPWPY